MKTDTPRPIYLKDYKPPAYLIDNVDLDIALDPTATEIKARLSLRPNPATPGSKGPLKLNGENLELLAISCDGVALDPAAYRVTDDALLVNHPPAGPFTLDIHTRIDPEANKALQGIYRSRGVYCSQCEAQGFRRITYFLDRPDILSRYRVRLEAPASEAPVLLSNGNLLAHGKIGRTGRHYAVWDDPFPKPCYLFAIVGGDLARVGSTFRTRSGRDVALDIYVEHGKQDRAAWAMDCLKRAFAWDERRFGREYDLDIFNIVAVSDFNMGAMENKGLNIFNDRLILASPRTATDNIYEAIESVVAHEYFHNWTGNRITCRDWFQLCLKEGLTVYRDQEFSGDERSAVVQRISDVRALKAHQFPEDAGPLAHPVRPDSYIEINNFYTPTVYEKGAEIVRMLATIVGAPAFRRGMDLYFERHDGEAATVEQFIRCFEDASGIDLSQFQLWYAQAGTPVLACEFHYDKTKRTAELRIEQNTPQTPHQTRKRPQHIPLRFGLIDQTGADIPLRMADGSSPPDGVLHVTARREVFRFVDVPERPVPSLLRSFSAPVNLLLDSSADDLEHRMRCDRDLFNRWQAADSYATRTILQLMADLAANREPSSCRPFAEALRRSLLDDTLEPAYRAELLRLPTQADIAREIARDVDPGLIHRAHLLFRRRLATHLADPLQHLYAQMAPRGRFSPAAAEAGKRAFRNGVLSLLAARARPVDRARVAEHFFKADNMTDEAHALALLAAQNTPDAKRALAAFHERWKDDHLVIDTWFSVQAQSPLASTLRRISALTRHPAYAPTAPNKVRALIGAFAQGNPLQFNRPDGAGYRFLTGQVLAIDRFNPQIAARMLAAFRSWRNLEPTRRAAAEAALRGVAQHKTLSKDVFEIVTKMLDPAN